MFDLSRSLALCAPETILQQRQVLAPAGRADILVMEAVLLRVPDAEGRLGSLQVLDVQPRREGLAAAAAAGGLALRPRAPVEVHPHLRRALEDVEELPERQVEQRED